MAASPIYSRFKSVASRLITRFDQDGFDVVIEASTPNPDPLYPPTVTTTDQRYRAVARGTSEQLRSSDPQLEDSTITVIIDSDQGYVPNAADHVKIDGKAMAIIRVDPIPAMGPICAYKFYLR